MPLIASLLLFSAANAEEIRPEGQRIDPTAEQIKYTGRIYRDVRGNVCFNYPGTEIRTGFTGTSLKMICRPMTGWFMVSIDGCPAFKVTYNSPRDSVVTLATALRKGRHTVRIMYAIEGLERHPEFHGFLIDRGATLFAPQMPRHLIEFIGNSITCAFGVESLRKEDPFLFETENHFYSYATIVSDSLGALHTAIARSGIGAYRNYGGPTAGSRDNMQYWYNYTLFGDTTKRWDFLRYTPDIVCINLGTNDISTPGYDISLFEKNYRSFLHRIRSLYPDASIVLLTGPMLSSEMLRLLRTKLDLIASDFRASGDTKIYRLDFTPQSSEADYGAGWHPSLSMQRRMAGELYPLLKKLLK